MFTLQLTTRAGRKREGESEREGGVAAAGFHHSSSFLYLSFLFFTSTSSD